MDMSFEAEWSSLSGHGRTPNHGLEPKWATLRELVRDKFAFFFSFSQDVVDDIKKLIPKEHREWSPQEKWWIVSAEYVEVCAKIAKTHLHVRPSRTYLSLSDERYARDSERAREAGRR